jgi:HSP20 family molecular chaperone IbpA
MFRTLFGLFNDKDFISEMKKSYSDLKKVYSNAFNGFEDVDGENSYALVINVPEVLTSSDVSVEYDDDDNTVTVETSYKNGSVQYSMKTTETLPYDADADTMSAAVANGVLTIVVDKKVVVEEEPVEETSPTVVKIKRKNK